ncbi:MAG: hemerythrin domain-containing protein [Gallionellaceae bacterium]|nr:hemerythrin domain-containing protein [Gallionellaceae bacterium]MDD5366016.1 hemerythrin domain-containing protein [Gallionellaceae bacterium]
MIDWVDAVHGLGIDEMDHTHREFTALVNLLNEADDADFAALFGKLLDHSRQHFSNEGRLMRISRFPALGEHEGEHHRVYGDLVQMNRAVQRGRLMLARAYVRTGLAEWFSLHLATMDSALAAHLKRTGESKVAMKGTALPVLS